MSYEHFEKFMKIVGEELLSDLGTSSKDLPESEAQKHLEQHKETMMESGYQSPLFGLMDYRIETFLYSFICLLDAQEDIGIRVQVREKGQWHDIREGIEHEMAGWMLTASDDEGMLDKALGEKSITTRMLEKPLNPDA